MRDETTKIAEKEKDNTTTESGHSKAYNDAMEKLNSYGLVWTFRAIDYVVNVENISFGQLRSCVFSQNGQLVMNYLKATVLLIKAGLVGAKKVSTNDAKALEDAAYEILDDWRNSGYFPGLLQLLIIQEMEKKHFFMGTQEMEVLKEINYSDSIKELGKVMRMNHLEEVINQAKALS